MALESINSEQFAHRCLRVVVDWRTSRTGVCLLGLRGVPFRPAKTVVRVGRRKERRFGQQTAITARLLLLPKEHPRLHLKAGYLPISFLLLVVLFRVGGRTQPQIYGRTLAAPAAAAAATPASAAAAAAAAAIQITATAAAVRGSHVSMVSVCQLIGVLACRTRRIASSSGRCSFLPNGPRGRRAGLAWSALILPVWPLAFQASTPRRDRCRQVAFAKDGRRRRVAMAVSVASVLRVIGCRLRLVIVILAIVAVGRFTGSYVTRLEVLAFVASGRG